MPSRFSLSATCWLTLMDRRRKNPTGLDALDIELTIGHAAALYLLQLRPIAGPGLSGPAGESLLKEVPGNTKSAQDDRAQMLAEPASSDKQEHIDPVRWVETGYVRARFGGERVLITPDMAAQIQALPEKQS